MALFSVASLDITVKIVVPKSGSFDEISLAYVGINGIINQNEVHLR